MNSSDIFRSLSLIIVCMSFPASCARIVYIHLLAIFMSLFKKNTHTINRQHAGKNVRTSYFLSCSSFSFSGDLPKKIFQETSNYYFLISFQNLGGNLWKVRLGFTSFLFHFVYRCIYVQVHRLRKSQKSRKDTKEILKLNKAVKSTKKY